MSQYELGVIGSGNMAEAIIDGAVAAGVLAADKVVSSDPLEERRRSISSRIGITTVMDNLVPAFCPHVLLAVKPQVIPEVLEQIAGAVQPDAAVISIAAGVTTSFIDSKLGGVGRIIRVMPNTPMLVGAGVSAIAAGPRATVAQIAWCQKLFAACGKTVAVGEEMMDAVTAVSGSGPAYFFYLIEAMIEAGVAEGLDADVATMLAAATCEGAGKLLSVTGEKPDVLRAQVTSPGGTTQRAIETLEAAGVKEALVKAVRAAAARSRELAG